MVKNWLLKDPSAKSNLGILKNSSETHVRMIATSKFMSAVTYLPVTDIPIFHLQYIFMMPSPSPGHK